MRSGVLVAGAVIALLVTGCSPSPVDDTTVASERVREVAVAAGEDPEECPLDLDVAAALEVAGVTDRAEPAGAYADVSETRTPAEDPSEAAVEEGLATVDIAAGSSVGCTFAVAGGELSVDLFTSVNDELPAPGAFAPLLVEAGLDREEVSSLLEDVGDPGSIEVAPGGRAVLANLRADEGTAALLVGSDGVTGDDLGEVTEALVGDLPS